MREEKYYLSLFLVLILITSSCFTVCVSSKESTNFTNFKNNSDDFYFVQITDTHLIYEKNDDGCSKRRFTAVLDQVTSFENKPKFIVITGDLVEFGGSDPLGAKNYETFVSCLYEKDGELYADSGLTIPVYTTPGNHDYIWETNLVNYHNYVDKKHESVDDRYKLSVGDISLFFMDSGPNYILEPWDWADVKGAGLFDEDIDWLENQFNSLTTKYNIVLMHHPAVNSRNNLGEMTNVIARNRERFVDLCVEYDIDFVLAGHTHNSVIYDSSENKNYNNFPLNCNDYPTLFVQTDDCKQGVHYRNISFIDGDLFIEKTKEIKTKLKPKNKERDYPIITKFFEKNSMSNSVISILLKLVNANLNLKF